MGKIINSLLFLTIVTQVKKDDLYTKKGRLIQAAFFLDLIKS